LAAIFISAPTLPVSRTGAAARLPALLPSQVLTLSYEDLVHDKARMVRRITAFLLPDFQLDEPQVSDIVAATEFDRLKSDISETPQSFHFNPDTFFRAGTVNDWEHHLSPQAAAAIQDRMQKSA